MHSGTASVSRSGSYSAQMHQQNQSRSHPCHPPQPSSAMHPPSRLVDDDLDDDALWEMLDQVERSRAGTGASTSTSHGANVNVNAANAATAPVKAEVQHHTISAHTHSTHAAQAKSHDLNPALRQYHPHAQPARHPHSHPTRHHDPSTQHHPPPAGGAAPIGSWLRMAPMPIPTAAHPTSSMSMPALPRPPPATVAQSRHPQQIHQSSQLYQARQHQQPHAQLGPSSAVAVQSMTNVHQAPSHKQIHSQQVQQQQQQQQQRQQQEQPPPPPQPQQASRHHIHQRHEQTPAPALHPRHVNTIHAKMERPPHQQQQQQQQQSFSYQPLQQRVVQPQAYPQPITPQPVPLAKAAPSLPLQRQHHHHDQLQHQPSSVAAASLSASNIPPLRSSGAMRPASSSLQMQIQDAADGRMDESTPLDADLHTDSVLKHEDIPQQECTAAASIEETVQPGPDSNIAPQHRAAPVLSPTRETSTPFLTPDIDLDAESSDDDNDDATKVGGENEDNGENDENAAEACWAQLDAQQQVLQLTQSAHSVADVDNMGKKEDVDAALEDDDAADLLPPPPLQAEFDRVAEEMEEEDENSGDEGQSDNERADADAVEDDDDDDDDIEEDADGGEQDGDERDEYMEDGDARMVEPSAVVHEGRNVGMVMETDVPPSPRSSQQRARRRAVADMRAVPRASAAAAAASSMAAGAPVASIPISRPSDHPPHCLGHYLPPCLSAAYRSELGIRTLYPWQIECLNVDGGAVLQDEEEEQRIRDVVKDEQPCSAAHRRRRGRRNLVYSAATSAGKTLVAEIIMFRYIMRYTLCPPPPSVDSTSSSSPSTGGGARIFRSLFIVPFHALVQEKVRDLNKIVRAMNKNIQREEKMFATNKDQGFSGWEGDAGPCHDPAPPQLRSTPFLDTAPPLLVKALDRDTDFHQGSPVLIGVCTIERALSLLTTLTIEGRTHELGCILIDEAHILGDRHRGFLLEHVLTKLKYIDEMRREEGEKKSKIKREEERSRLQSSSQVKDSDSSTRSLSFTSDLPPLQIVCLSATLPNIQHLCDCLDASFYRTDFRPVKLDELYAVLENAQPPVRIGGNMLATSAASSVTTPSSLPSLALYNAQGLLQRRLSHPSIPRLLADRNPLDPLLLGFLCWELVSRGGHGLVFCPSKGACSQAARCIAQVIRALSPQPQQQQQQQQHNVSGVDRTPQSRPRGYSSHSPASLASMSIVERRNALMERLSTGAVGLDRTLAITILYGVAFHHAGLSLNERSEIESAYRDHQSGCLQILCATTTLACGINIGASRVMFLSLKTGWDNMSPALYRQCAGRAGRAGIDAAGESIILHTNASLANTKPMYTATDRSKHVAACRHIMNAPLEPLRSCLDQTEQDLTIILPPRSVPQQPTMQQQPVPTAPMTLKGYMLGAKATAPPVPFAPRAPVPSSAAASAPAVPPGPPALHYPNLSRLLLDALCSGLVQSRKQLGTLARLSLLYFQLRARVKREESAQKLLSSNTKSMSASSVSSAADRAGIELEAMVESCIEWLERNEFITRAAKEDRPQSPLSPTQTSMMVVDGNTDGAESSDNDLTFHPTSLGHAATKAGLALTDALVLHGHLSLVRPCVILEGGLHLLFLCTPLKNNLDVKWELFAQMLDMLRQQHEESLRREQSRSKPHGLSLAGNRLSPHLRVVSLLGIEEGLIMNWMHNPPSSTDARLHLYRRFYAALIILFHMQWENESVVSGIGDESTGVQQSETIKPHPITKYHDIGSIQSLCDTARTFGHQVASFAECLNWIDLHLLIREFASEQLVTAALGNAIGSNHGTRPLMLASMNKNAPSVQHDLPPLKDLMIVPGMKPRMAHALYSKGLTTVRLIAQAKMDVVIGVVRACRNSFAAVLGDNADLSVEDEAESLVQSARRLDAAAREREHKAKMAQVEWRERKRRLTMMGTRTANTGAGARGAHTELGSAAAATASRTAAQSSPPIHTPASATHPTGIPPNTPSSLSTPSPGTNAFHLLNNLRSPGTTPPFMPQRTSQGQQVIETPPDGGAMNLDENKNSSSETVASSIIDLFSYSLDQWHAFHQRLLDSSHIYWQFFGIRRTPIPSTKKKKQKQQNQQHGGELDALTQGAVAAAADAPSDNDDEDDLLGLSQEEEDDLICSPEYRTILPSSSFALYPISLSSVSGVAIMLHDDPHVYHLHIAERYNNVNEEGVNGAVMFEAFCEALLKPSILKASFNMKTNLLILNSLPMPISLVNTIYQRTRTKAMSSGQHGKMIESLYPKDPAAVSFLTLLNLISDTHHPCNLIDLRVAHWMFMPDDKNLLQVERYYEYYVLKCAGAQDGGARGRTKGTSTANTSSSGSTSISNSGGSNVPRPLPAPDADGGIPCSPDRRSQSRFNVAEAIRRAQERLKKTSSAHLLFSAGEEPTRQVQVKPIAPAAWQQTTMDRYRYPTSIHTAAATLRTFPQLFPVLLHHLSSSLLLRPLLECETPFTPVLAHMECFGMGVDRRGLEAHIRCMQDRLNYLDHMARLYLPSDEILDSPREMVMFMSNSLKLDMPKWFEEQQRKKGNKGAIKGISKLLTELANQDGAHPLPAIIEERRLLSLVLAHLLPLPSKALPRPSLGMHRIHPTLLHTTSTGRLSCQEPNVQCIPKKNEYRTVPRYSVHEELQRGRLSVDSSSSSSSSDRARIHFHLNEAEKRVEAQRRTAALTASAKKKGRNSIATQQVHLQSTSNSSASPSSLFSVLIQHPNGELRLGRLVDISNQSIMAPGVWQWAGPFAPPPAIRNMPFAQYWTDKRQAASSATASSSSLASWSSTNAQSIRQVLITYDRKTLLPVPAAHVWRVEAYVSWEEDVARRKEMEKNTVHQDADVNMASDGDAAASTLPSRSAATTPTGPPVPRPYSSLVSFSVRDSFIAAPGYVLLSVDYSNIELRMMAHFSRDQSLMEMFKMKVDVLSEMAARMFHKSSAEDVTAQERATAKSCVYGCLYGAGEALVADNLGVSRPIASGYLDQFRSTFNGVTSFIRKLKTHVAKEGFVTTLFGRKRSLRLCHRFAKTRSSEERKVANTLCQGSAADLIKAAMTRILQKLARTDQQPKCKEKARLIMQMHDELILEVKEEYVEEVTSLICREMEFDASRFSLRVPLVVRTKIGRSWGSMTPMQTASKMGHAYEKGNDGQMNSTGINASAAAATDSLHDTTGSVVPGPTNMMR